jgi:hypothetical protein
LRGLARALHAFPLTGAQLTRGALEGRLDCSGGCYRSVHMPERLLLRVP